MNYLLELLCAHCFVVKNEIFMWYTDFQARYPCKIVNIQLSQRFSKKKISIFNSTNLATSKRVAIIEDCFYAWKSVTFQVWIPTLYYSFSNFDLPLFAQAIQLAAFKSEISRPIK